MSAEQAVRWMIGLVLAAAAGAKLLTPVGKAAILPPWALVTVAIAELAAAACLATRCFRIGLLVALALAISGALAAFTAKAACGCLGSAITLTKSQELLLAGSVGVLACLGVVLTEISALYGGVSRER
jgi:fructose-specific phosphotransferase system IIC component